MMLTDVLRRALGKRSEVYRQAFSTPSGKWVLDDLATRFHAMRDTYVRGDPHETAHREGMRHVLTFIFAQMELTNQDVREMVEQHSRSGEYLE